MPISIDGVSYVSTGEILVELGIARQTLWRWRREGKIPQGNRYRDRQVLFTQAEAGSIREFANRIEPADQRKAASPVPRMQATRNRRPR